MVLSPKLSTAELVRLAAYLDSVFLLGGQKKGYLLLMIVDTLQLLIIPFQPASAIIRLIID